MASEYQENNPQISVVLPVYCNANTLPELHLRLSDILKNLGIPYELIFINDACPEGSLGVLKHLAETDPCVSVLVLSENQGQQRAVMTGVGYARGDTVVIMDSDLQDPPEDVPRLIGKMGEDFAAVFAGRRGYYEPITRLVTSRLHKSLLHLITGIPIDAGLFVAINGQMVKHLLDCREPDPYVVAMIACANLPTTSIPVTRSKRRSGTSAYTFWKRMKYGIGALKWAISWKLRTRTLRTKPIAEIYPADNFIGSRFGDLEKRSKLDFTGEGKIASN